jgi:transcriptional regulator of acetoin/glycerol metabolism
MHSQPLTVADPSLRLLQIERARHAVMHGSVAPAAAVEPWIERSWRRCLTAGLSPGQRVGFDVISRTQLRRTLAEHRNLIEAAQPVLASLRQAMAQTRYFAILTNAHGVVVDAHGPIDRDDRRAAVITRIGADLSERAVGTTAISAALIEQHPVWLHRGEHFFDDTSVYSCAGAPLFGPDGRCLGMLDLTGIDAAERPELRHLVAQVARRIENSLALRVPHRLLLRFNWPGHTLGTDGDGLLCLDGEGRAVAANSTARSLLPALARQPDTHANELFATPVGMLFDAARHEAAPLDLPLWTGLRLQVWARAGDGELERPQTSTVNGIPSLKDLELSLIRKAVADARGNVKAAARALGISRATVYRKLGRRN